ncbi:DUF2179 domain-containing protein [bacterium]|nr:DUF2179 domain-containing protein [candidate division CSSED10-310 bacterium]
MINVSLIDSQFYAWIILPCLIGLARILDVSIGTIRLIFVAKGYKYWAPILGFFEVLVWIIVIGEVMKNLNNPACYVGYAAGFAAGNFMGIWLEEKLSIGMVIIRIIAKENIENLVEFFKSKKIGVTIVDAEGAYGKVKILFSIINREDYTEVAEKIHEFNPKAFYSVEDVRSAREGVFPLHIPVHKRLYGSLFRSRIKGK